MSAVEPEPATITLHEYQDTTVELEPAEIEAIATRLRGRIALSRPLAGPGVTLNPMQHAGIAVLPSGRRLECCPKVPLRNLFTMLAVAFDLDPGFLPEGTAVRRWDDLFEFVIRYFAELVDERLRRGLYRAYAEREESLASIRGRIAIAEDMRRNVVTRQLTHCRFTEFTWDIPENQVIRQVVHLAGQWARSPELRRSLHVLDHRLGEISPVVLAPAVLDRFAYHRLNDDYRPIHRICQLLLTGSGLSEHAGEIAFRTFLFDMSDLFERFVTNLLRRELAPRLDVAAQRPVSLGTRGEVAMYPDIVVSDGVRPILAIDCKYKRLAPGETKHHDVYQLTAYCTALDVREGLLIYPAHEHRVDSTFDVRHAAIRIRQATLDLGVEEGFLAHCRAFASATIPPP